MTKMVFNRIYKLKFFLVHFVLIGFIGIPGHAGTTTCAQALVSIASESKTNASAVIGKNNLVGSEIFKATYEGPAHRLHKVRFDEIIATLNRHNVSVNWTEAGDGEPWTGGYGPGSKGFPGSIRLHRDIDLRTLEHEFQHFIDDKARGFPGLWHYLEHPAEMFKLEQSAYELEINLVRKDSTLSQKTKMTIIKELLLALAQEETRYLGATP
jgi:hypothetical protein